MKDDDLDMERALLELSRALAVDPAVSDATRAAAQLLATAAQEQLDDLQHQVDVVNERAAHGMA